MLLALTPNPAIDRTLVVPGFRPAEVTRVVERRDAAGGKGLNVARVARTLGLAVRALGPLAGATGRSIADLAAAEGIEARWAWLPSGESRICLLICDPEAQDTLVVNEQGPLVDAEGWQLFEQLVRLEAGSATAVASSGSLPPGARPERFHTLLAELAIDLDVLLDCSGAVLRGALGLPLALLKVNQHEIGDALGRPISGPAEAAVAAQEVCRRGARAAIITLGRHGAVAADATGAWFAPAPQLSLVSPVGSGDAVMAGAAAVLLAGGQLPEALRSGVACGSANALTLGAGIVRREDLARLLAGIAVERYT
jgi:1-phosphofructokinase family hexose kinase